MFVLFYFEETSSSQSQYGCSGYLFIGAFLNGNSLLWEKGYWPTPVAFSPASSWWNSAKKIVIPGALKKPINNKIFKKIYWLEEKYMHLQPVFPYCSILLYHSLQSTPRYPSPLQQKDVREGGREDLGLKKKLFSIPPAREEWGPWP